MRRRAIVFLVLLGLLGGTSTALAQPPPPPNPSDDELSASGQAVDARAAEVGRLSGALAELDARAEDLAIQLAGQRETAEAALVDYQAAQGAAALAADRAENARLQTEAATVAIDAARARLDEFVTATYQEGLDLGPLGLLTSAQTPEELVERAEFTDLMARIQLQAQDGLERARVEKANADADARALLEEARAAEEAAEEATAVADTAVAAAEEAARAQAEQLAAVQAERAGVAAQLAAAESADAGLRDQRARFVEFQRRIAEEEAARQRADQLAAMAREEAAGPAPQAGSGAVARVIDRAMSQLGVQYVWGGGNGRGPSTGIPDGLGSPLNRVGFDCSGLMLYAFNGAGVSLPRVSRNQFTAGRQVPISDLQPGDMVFYRSGGAPIHHVAMYIGNNRMIEAPYTGANVRVVPLRRDGLVPEATRVL